MTYCRPCCRLCPCSPCSCILPHTTRCLPGHLVCGTESPLRTGLRFGSTTTRYSILSRYWRTHASRSLPISGPGDGSNRSRLMNRRRPSRRTAAQLLHWIPTLSCEANVFLPVSPATKIEWNEESEGVRYCSHYSPKRFFKNKCLLNDADGATSGTTVQQAQGCPSIR